MRPLTPRQLEVLQCYLEGYRPAEMEVILRCSDNTVKDATKAIKTKLKAKTLAHAITIWCTKGQHMNRFRHTAVLVVGANEPMDVLVEVIRGCAILRAEHLLQCNRIEYHICHPDLPELPFGDEPPRVEALMHTTSIGPRRVAFVNATTKEQYG